MSLTLKRLQQRGNRITTFVSKFKGGLSFWFTDRTQDTLDEIDVANTKFSPNDPQASIESALSSARSGTRVKVTGKIKGVQSIGKLAITRDLGGQFDPTGTGTLSTETWSEILSMYAFAYRMRNNTSLSRENFVDASSGGLNMETYNSIKGRMFIQSKETLTKQVNRDKLARFGTLPMSSSGATRNNIWLDSANKQAELVISTYNIPSNAMIYSDKLYEYNNRIFPRTGNPYQIFARKASGMSSTLNTTIKPDKWNPADMWIMTRRGLQDMIKFNRLLSRMNSFNTNTINNFLHKKYDDREIFPISLKKLDPQSPHVTLVNSKYFVEQIDIKSQTNPPIIEFTPDNQDVKINFSLRTIQLAKGKNPMQSQGRINDLNGTEVRGSEKRVMLKYNVNKEQLEVFFSQTGTTPGQARHGSVGKELMTRVISETSQEGIQHLNTLKQNYINGSNLELNQDNRFFISQRVAINDNNRSTALGYLGELWADIRDDNDTVVPGRFATKYGTNNDSVKKKVVSGEIGISINRISNQTVKTRVIQNLYNAAASIGIMSGLSKKDQSSLSAGGATPPSNKLTPTMLGGIHIKVY